MPRKHPKHRRKTQLIMVISVVLAAIGVVAALLYLLSIHVWTKKLRAIADTQENIAYCNSRDPQQTLDLYRPRGHTPDSLPLLVYIHGGGWRAGDKDNRMINTYGPLFLAHRMAVASLGYRLHTPSPYPDQNRDIACALTYLTSHASQLRIDSKKMILFGESAGGELAAFAALNKPYQNYSYDPPLGVIDFYGVSDFSPIINGKHADLNARRYLSSHLDQAAAASPVTYVTTSAPHFLLVHGTNDRIVPISQSQLLYDRLVKAGVDAEYIVLANAPHGFVGPELSANTYKTIQSSITSFLQETVGH